MCLKYEVRLVEDDEQEGVDKAMLIIVVCKQVICVGGLVRQFFSLCRHVVSKIILL